MGAAARPRRALRRRLKLSSPKFSNQQREQLRKHGLNAQQIHALERIVLPFGRAWLRGSAPIAGVRKAIDDLRGSAVGAAKLLQSMLNAATSAQQRSALAEAGNRLLASASESGAHPEELEAFASALSHLSAWSGDAIAKLPRQRYSRDASPLPIARIAEAIAGGSEVEEYVGPDGESRARVLRVAKVNLSSSSGSPFREICGICYEVMTGKAAADPERAIKAYMALRRQRRADGQRGPFNSGLPKFDIPGPARTGRQVKKKSGLAS